MRPLNRKVEKKTPKGSHEVVTAVWSSPWRATCGQAHPLSPRPQRGSHKSQQIKIHTTHKTKKIGKATNDFAEIMHYKLCID